MGSNAQIPRLGPLVAQAWRAFERAVRLPSRVSPAIPILFFGDIDAYCRSPVRMLTVGLNPSLEEFPARKPFRRFPVAASVTADDRDRYVKALSAYFRTDPYHTWFRHFEPLLNGARSNYYPGWPSTALHTDICSPVATNPTWSRLSNSDRATLEVYGLPLWHSLLEALRPHVVVLSVARSHLDRIVFDALDRWKVMHTFGTDGQRQTLVATVCRPGMLVRHRWRPIALRLLSCREDASHDQQPPETRRRRDRTAGVDGRPIGAGCQECSCHGCRGGTRVVLATSQDPGFHRDPGDGCTSQRGRTPPLRH